LITPLITKTIASFRLDDSADGLPPAQRIVVMQITDKLEGSAAGVDTENSKIYPFFLV